MLKQCEKIDAKLHLKEDIKKSSLNIISRPFFINTINLITYVYDHELSNEPLN